MLFLQTVTDSATLEEKLKELWRINLINILLVRKCKFLLIQEFYSTPKAFNSLAQDLIMKHRMAF